MPLSAGDATILAILAENPRTARWQSLVDRIKDPLAKRAAVMIIDPAQAADDDQRVRDLAEDVRRWADRNRRHAAAAG